MAFGIPTTIPNIPGLSGITTPPMPGLSDSAKSAITDLTSLPRSALFTNPMGGAINSVSDTVNALETKLTLIASGNVTNNVISSGDASTFLSGNGLSNLRISIGSLTSHTQRLAGVLQSGGISSPGLEEIVTIGKMMNTMANVIDGSQGCLNVIGASTGLFSQDQVNGLAGSITSIIDQIDKEVATITDITALVVNAKSYIEGIVNKDTNFLGQCVNQLQKSVLGHALAAAMSDPCTKFIIEQAANRNFLEKLQLPPITSIGAK